MNMPLEVDPAALAALGQQAANDVATIQDILRSLKAKAEAVTVAGQGTWVGNFTRQIDMVSKTVSDASATLQDHGFRANRAAQIGEGAAQDLGRTFQ